jgi:tetratricopeptide (TPR) repeat protein
LRQAYELNLKYYGPNALETAAVMYPLGSLCYMRGDYPAADSWFERALPAYRKHALQADFEIRRIVGILSDAAFVKRALGRLDDAEALWREGLAYTPALPEKYRGQSMSIKTFLAQLYLDRGDVQDADALAFQASQELRAFGRDRFSLAQSLIDLGNVRRLEHRYAEADALIQEGTDLYAQAQGKDHPNVAYGFLSLSVSRYYQGRYDLAEEDARKALDIVARLGKATHQYAAVIGMLGRILNRTGRSREAEGLLKQALAIQKEKGHRRADVAAAESYLGECLLTQQRYSEAEPLLRDSYTSLKTLQVRQSPALKEARERLASLYAAWGKPPLVAY